jgi:hypothetical protein
MEECGLQRLPLCYDTEQDLKEDLQMSKLHGVSIANAVIWAAAIIGAAIVLRGAPHAGQVVVILGGAAGASVIIVGNALHKATEKSASRTDSDAPMEIKAGQNG